jgi:outer membrane protein assembly factor BamA
MKSPLLIVMLASTLGFAQTGGKRAAPTKPAPAAHPASGGASQKFTIASLNIEGNRNFTREQILAIARLKPGQAASKADFEAARDRLVACGAFENVSYRYSASPKGDGVAAVLELDEVEQVYPVDFQDLHVSSLELDAYLSSKDPLYSREKLPATHPVLQRYAKWVQEFLDSKGLKEKIAASVQPAAETGDYNIVIRPARPLPTVAQVTFEGNQVLPQDKLREAIAGAVGASYTEDSFRQTLNSVVRPLYENKGHVRVTFPELRTEKATDVEGLHVFVTVHEGVSYELGRVNIDGPTPIASDVLVKAGEFKPGGLADMSKVNEGVERVRRAIRREGYMEVRVSADRKMDDEKKTVNVTIHVLPGPQFTMGKLNITGLDLNAEPEIRRIWILKPGKPFNPEYPDLFLRRIKEQGLFDNLSQTKAEYQLNQKDHTADVTLIFSGGPPPGPGRGGRGRGGY